MLFPDVRRVVIIEPEEHTDDDDDDRILGTITLPREQCSRC